MTRGRYAPTPSGPLHVGNLRTALVAWLFAHHAGSELALRIDDLDPGTRQSPHEHGQLADLAAVGVTFAPGSVRQSERLSRYEAALSDLEATGFTYPCFCSRREIREATVAPHEHLPDGAYPGTCRDLSDRDRARRAEHRPAAVRIRAGGAEVAFFDDLHGPVTGHVDDFVVRRNDGVPAYNLATVIDDNDQGVGQVVRGDDLLAGTARQVWLGRRLGMAEMRHAHVPLIVNDSGERLAKRDGAVTLGELVDLGASAEDVRVLLLRSLGITTEPGEPLAEVAARFHPPGLATEPTVWDPAPLGLAPR